jgi:hypothetical protein
MCKLLSFLFSLLLSERNVPATGAPDETIWEHLDGAEFSVVVDRDPLTRPE